MVVATNLLAVSPLNVMAPDDDSPVSPLSVPAIVLLPVTVMPPATTVRPVANEPLPAEVTLPLLSTMKRLVPPLCSCSKLPPAVSFMKMLGLALLSA